MNENTVPEYARLFAARCERQGLFQSRTDAFMNTPQTVFVRVVLCPDLPTARLVAERSLNAATWASARAAGIGITVQPGGFLRNPSYLVGELENGKLIEAYLNAAAICAADLDTFRRLKAAALEAAEEYRVAISKGVWPIVQWGLTHPQRRPSFRLQSLDKSEDSPILELLNRLGIE